MLQVLSTCPHSHMDMNIYFNSESSHSQMSWKHLERTRNQFKESENLFVKISFGRSENFLSFLKELLLFSEQCVLNLLKLAQNFLIFVKGSIRIF